MPDSTPEESGNGEQEMEIFLSALKIPPGRERDEFVRDRCDGDETLRRQLEALFAAHQNDPDGFLSSPAVDAFCTTRIGPDLPEELGARIGNYQLLEVIGQGGFGIVYRARQLEPLRRDVALKLLRPGMDTREILARFETEKNVLARMEHPNIAQVHDAGSTEQGRPYFVMELVRGEPITRFCDRKQFTIEQRLELFVPVCRAVHHAHQKGVVHRDLKPSNVLVIDTVDGPLPKVIDFGVAKALWQDLNQESLLASLSLAGAMIGTPQYMSPEQVASDSTEIGPWSDVYALGVMLYELLTGRTPLDRERLRQAGLAALQQLLAEDPPTPRTRMGKLDGKEAEAIAKARAASPRQLRQLIGREIDWVVMKAMDHHAPRRWQSAKELSDCLSDHLSGKPLPVPGSWRFFRITRFFRKRRAMVGIGALILSLVTGLGLAIREVQKAKTQPPPKPGPVTVTSSPPPQGAAVERSPGEEFTNSAGMILCWIPEGRGFQGSAPDEEGRYGDEPLVELQIVDGFWAGKTEVTQAQWEKVMGTTIRDQARRMIQDTTMYNNGSSRKTAAEIHGVSRDESDPALVVLSEGPEFPMYFVNWNDAREFCKKLTREERKGGGLEETERYDLATQAQWEYACRTGGAKALYEHDLPDGDGTADGEIKILGEFNAPQLDPIAWYGGNSGVDYEGKGWSTADWIEKQVPEAGVAGPRKVGQKLPNRWGLHDMIGNVWEWTADPANENGISFYRGGSWRSFARFSRAAFRSWGFPSIRSNELGFRVILIQDRPRTAPKVTTTTTTGPDSHAD